VTAIDRDALETERDFLLRSLDDLDAEYAAGNVDEDTYRLLHDDYTARAAAVIRALDGSADGMDAVEVAPGPERRRTSLWMRVTVFTLVATFALGGSFALTRAVGTRAPGGTTTGNEQVTGGAGSDLDSLRRAAEEAPDDYDARVAYARALLGENPPEALAQYDAARRIDPTQPEPPTYMGWITALAAQGSEPGAQRDELVDRSLAWFGRALELDGGYEDAYVFRGLLRLNVLGDAAAAVPDFQQFLVLAPSDHPMREVVLGALERAVAAAPTTVAPDP
jgi:tetratricopeptide (TPR) repeat protein